MLTCYIEGQGDRWRGGGCVDFDLTVFGASIDEVKRLLEAAVSTYIEDASREAPPDRDRLLNRKSPWYTRLSWRLNVLASRIGHAFNGNRREAPLTSRYDLYCPA